MIDLAALFSDSSLSLVLGLALVVFLLVIVVKIIFNSTWRRDVFSAMMKPKTIGENFILVLVIGLLGLYIGKSFEKSSNPYPQIELTCSSSGLEKTIKITNTGNLAGEDAYLHIYYKNGINCSHSSGVLDSWLWQDPDELKGTKVSGKGLFPLPKGNRIRDELGYSGESLEYRRFILPGDDSYYGMDCEAKEEIWAILSGKNFPKTDAKC